MNRNVESHFSQIPNANIKRSIFDRSSGHKTSFNVGELIPLYVDEILPGDSVNITTSKVVRLQTLLTPIMDNVYMDTYWFFVPNRLCWEHWKQFCGENTASPWVPSTTYEIPTIKSPTGGFAVGTIADYMGLPVNTEFKEARLPSALPFRAYALIVDQFFRDQNLTDPLNIPLGDATQQGSNGDSYVSDVANGGKPFRVCKYHDYFTSCLPNPQKGQAPSVKIGSDFIGGDFPVYSKNVDININKFYEVPKIEQSLRFYGLKYNNDSDGNVIDDPAQVVKPTYLYGFNEDDQGAAFKAANGPNGKPSAPNGYNMYPLNLWANVPSQSLSGSPIDINQLRLAFQTQRFLERNARGGTRYVEILQSHFGVVSPDARLQRPEYLGGNRIPLNINSVSNTAQSDKDFLGDLGANSVTSDVHGDVVKSFTEHGYLMCVGCVRYDHTYSQGMERFWSRKQFTDFFLPVFSGIGEQPVFSDELYYVGNDDVFAYQEAWGDYRYKPNRVSSLMRPNVSNTLASWHLADNYDSVPTLSDSWIREDKSIVDRVLAVSSANSNQVFCDLYFKAIYTRPMPMYSVPGLIDHN